MNRQGKTNNNFRHGHYGTPVYETWHAMKQRCYNPKHISYQWYGGKGVQVCDQWLRFENFLADMGEKPEGMTIDRIDSNLNYTPSNCRWATSKQQSRDKARDAEGKYT